MTTRHADAETTATAAPPRLHLAIMIWLAVLPTLTVAQLLLNPVLDGLPLVARTTVLATVVVPIVVYLVLPRLHRLRAALVARP